MKDSLILKFLYKTALGRLLLKLLVQPKVSQMAGKLLSSKISKCLVPYYIRKHKIDMEDIEIPHKGFVSFNDFFTRKRNAECLDGACGRLISPCDGFFTPVRIRKSTVFQIKHTQYSLKDLLKDEELAKLFGDGMALIFRLTPADYHRYCYSADGKILSSRKIQGKLHCVRPIALETIPVYIQNSREYQVIKTEKFGTMVQMEIGALLVGKIKNYKRPPEKMEIQAGEEKGYFEFGGSTIVLLLQKDAICMNQNLYKKNKNHAEIRVRRGELMEKYL
ncbi:MAG: phosphatidylserine decarboxylase [Roseburia sp.]